MMDLALVMRLTEVTQKLERLVLPPDEAAKKAEMEAVDAMMVVQAKGTEESKLPAGVREHIAEAKAEREKAMTAWVFAKGPHLRDDWGFIESNGAGKEPSAEKSHFWSKGLLRIDEEMRSWVEERSKRWAAELAVFMEKKSKEWQAETDLEVGKKEGSLKDEVMGRFH